MTGEHPLPPTSDEPRAGDQQRPPVPLDQPPMAQDDTAWSGHGTLHEHRTSDVTVDVLEVARAWLSEDPDAATRAELEDLLAAPDPVAALGDRFTGRLQFGTAGLRGAEGAGPNRMNRLVVARATAGLVAYLEPRGASRVVIGYDARTGSHAFALEAAGVVAGAGLDALLLPRPLPTPVLAFAVRHLEADAGIMITASHNPASDNGYKVYLGDGSQIVPPADEEISAEIDRVGAYAFISRTSGWTILGEDVLDAYVARAVAVLDPSSARDVRAVYTPLHGVGGEVARRVLGAAGFPEPVVVPEQADPDAAFPTVSFPNPEEPGALDLALALAQSSGADVVVANDPDADRLALAVPAAGGTWHPLTGDETGVLLAWHLLRRGRLAGGTVAASLVSSSLLAKLAAANGIASAPTLTGFKWISRVPELRYGYEEALGYCVDPDGVRDKDGLTAMLVALELVAALKAEGRSVLDALADIYAEHGVHLTAQVSLRLPSAAQIADAVERLRADPPAEIGAVRVVAVDDLAAGVDRLPPTDGVRLRLDGDARVIVRPSGTEPKVKAYLEVVRRAENGDVASAARTAGEVRDRLADGVRTLLSGG